MKPYYDHAGITIYHGDCREILPRVSADVLVTDPPYGTGGWRRPATGQGADCRAVLVREEWDDGAAWWLGLSTAPVLAFWPPATASVLLAAAIASGRPKHRAIYWRKPDPKPQVGGRTAWSVEPIWALGPEGFLLLGGTDVHTESAPRLNRDADAVDHPYQKPTGLMQWAISKCPPGNVVDPFMGSGTTLVAAKNLGRKAIGIEIEEKYCEIAARRLSQEVLPLATPGESR